MDDVTNKLVREFYLGDYDAWDTFIKSQTNPTLRFLKRQFPYLPDDLRYNLFSQFVVDFFLKVKKGHEEADKLIQNSTPKLTAEEIVAKKIERCTVNAKFDLSYGYSFKSWMFKKLIWRGLDVARKQNIIVEPLDDNNDLESLSGHPQDLPEQLVNLSGPGVLEDENKLKKLLETALEDNEIIYLKVWFEHGPDPHARLVKDEIARETGKDLMDPAISKLKQNFIMKSSLKLLEHIDKASALADLFGRLIEIDNIDEKIFVVMMDNIWKAFYLNEPVRRISRTEISPHSWVQWDASTHKRKIQEQILVEAYRYFRLSSPLPYFCYLIELYSNNRFGVRVRQLFMEGGEKKQNGR